MNVGMNWCSLTTEPPLCHIVAPLPKGCQAAHYNIKPHNWARTKILSAISQSVVNYLMGGSAQPASGQKRLVHAAM